MKLVTRLLGTAAVVWINTTSVIAAPPAKPDLVVALGDSMTAATLANTFMSGKKPDPSALAMIQKLKNSSDLLDRFGAGFFSIKALSWATGTKINSDLKLFSNLLEQQTGESNLAGLNLAVPGDTVAGVKKQVDQLFKELKSGKYGDIRLITILIGANDACSSATPEGTPNEEVRLGMLQIFERLAAIQQSQPLRILVAALPRIAELGRPEIMNDNAFAGVTCDQFQRRYLKFCQPLLDWKTPEEYFHAGEVVKRKNRTLAQAIQEALARHPNLDIHFSKAIENLDITAKDLAMDCFHPNWKAQERVADLLWKDQPWFK